LNDTLKEHHFEDEVVSKLIGAQCKEKDPLVLAGYVDLNDALDKVKDEMKKLESTYNMDPKHLQSFLQDFEKLSNSQTAQSFQMKNIEFILENLTKSLQISNIKNAVAWTDPEIQIKELLLTEYGSRNSSEYAHSITLEGLKLITDAFSKCGLIKLNHCWGAGHLIEGNGRLQETYLKIKTENPKIELFEWEDLLRTIRGWFNKQQVDVRTCKSALILMKKEKEKNIETSKFLKMIYKNGSDLTSKAISSLESHKQIQN